MLVNGKDKITSLPVNNYFYVIMVTLVSWCLCEVALMRLRVYDGLIKK